MDGVKKAEYGKFEGACHKQEWMTREKLLILKSDEYLFSFRERSLCVVYLVNVLCFCCGVGFLLYGEGAHRHMYVSWYLYVVSNVLLISHIFIQCGRKYTYNYVCNWPTYNQFLLIKSMQLFKKKNALIYLLDYIISLLNSNIIYFLTVDNIIIFNFWLFEFLIYFFLISNTTRKGWNCIPRLD